jgi:protoheme IX farnesyltransferase
MKPRVMSLVVFTAFVGFYTATPVQGYSIHPFLACVGIFAIALGAGASGVLNQWYDRDIDKIMVRTKDRPIPLGKILPSEAFSFGIISSILSIMILGLAVNWLAAGLLAFTIFFLCSCLYNMAKEKHCPKYCYRRCGWSFPSSDRSNLCYR